MWPIRFVEGSQPGKKKKDDVHVHVGRETCRQIRSSINSVGSPKIDGVVDSMLVSDLLKVGGFLRVLRFPPPIKLTAMIKLEYI